MNKIPDNFLHKGVKTPRWLVLEQFSGSPSGRVYAMLSSQLLSKAQAHKVGEDIATRIGRDVIVVMENRGPRRNPTLVHHGKARSARWHVVTAADNYAVADLYGMLEPNTASKITRELATALGAPLLLLSNFGQPATLGEHSVAREASGSLEHRPQRNPAGRPRAGELWTTRTGGRCKVLAVSGQRVQVLHMETGNREWIEMPDFLASYKLTRGPQANPKGLNFPKVRADSLKVGDMVMPPEREMRLWMIRHAAEIGMSPADLGILLTDVHEGEPDKRGRWIWLTGYLRDQWYQGRKQSPFKFKARPDTPWPVAATPTRENPSRSSRARYGRKGLRRTFKGVGGRRTRKALAKGQPARARYHALQSKYRYRQFWAGRNPSSRRRISNPFERVAFIAGGTWSLQGAAGNFAETYWAKPRNITGFEIDPMTNTATFGIKGGAGGVYRASFVMSGEGGRGVMIEKDRPAPNPRRQVSELRIGQRMAGARLHDFNPPHPERTTVKSTSDFDIIVKEWPNVQRMESVLRTQGQRASRSDDWRPWPRSNPKRRNPVTRAQDLLVKGSKFQAARAAADRGIPAAYRTEIRYKDGTSETWITVGAQFHDLISKWFADTPVWRGRAPIGTLLYYRDSTRENPGGRDYHRRGPAARSLWHRNTYPQHIARVTGTDRAAGGMPPMVNFEIVTGRGDVMSVGRLPVNEWFASYSELEPGSPYRGTIPNPRGGRSQRYQFRFGKQTAQDFTPGDVIYEVVDMKTGATVFRSYNERDARGRASYLNKYGPEVSRRPADHPSANPRAPLAVGESVRVPYTGKSKKRTSERGHVQAIGDDGIYVQVKHGKSGVVHVWQPDQVRRARREPWDVRKDRVSSLESKLELKGLRQRRKEAEAEVQKAQADYDCAEAKAKQAQPYHPEDDKTNYLRLRRQMAKLETLKDAYAALAWKLERQDPAHVDPFAPEAQPESNPAEPICYGQTITRNAVQEWYETASRHAGVRARQLRKAGFRVVSSGMGPQVTPVGTVNMTMLTIYGDPDNLPAVRVERMNPRAAANPRGSEMARAKRTSEMWHEFPPSHVRRVKGPGRVIPETLVALGEAVKIDYKSNKYTGRMATYTHSFKRPRPILATDPDAKHLHIVGGKVKITADGLVN